MLRAFPDHHRATPAWKCDGLADEQLRTGPVAPSTLTLLGLAPRAARRA